MSKLVISSTSFSEIYNYSDSKKYFYDVVSFDKKAIVSVNANVEVGYDLSKLDIQIDSIAKKKYINNIPKSKSIFHQMLSISIYSKVNLILFLKKN